MLFFLLKPLHRVLRITLLSHKGQQNLQCSLWQILCALRKILRIILSKPYTSIPARCTCSTVLKVISPAAIIECSQRTRLRVAWPRWTVVTSCTNSGCLRSDWTIISYNALFTILNKPPSCLIEECSLGARFLYWSIGANTQAWDSICDVCWAVEALITVTGLNDGLFKTVFSSRTHCTVIYTLSIGVWVECTNRTWNFYRVT